jgi:hypothetical protein
VKQGDERREKNDHRRKESARSRAAFTCSVHAANYTLPAAEYSMERFMPKIGFGTHWAIVDNPKLAKFWEPRRGTSIA